MTRVVPILAAVAGCVLALALGFSCRAPSEAQQGASESAAEKTVAEAPQGTSSDVDRYRELVAQAPTLPSLRLTLARHYERTFEGKGDEATRGQLLTALCLRPDDPDALFELGQVLFRLKRYRAASEWLKRAVEAEPDSWVRLHWLALAYIRSGRPEEAVDPLRQATRLAPEERDPRRRAADVFSRQGLAQEARVHLRWLARNAKADEDRQWAETELILLDMSERRYWGPAWNATDPPGIGPLRLRTNSSFERARRQSDPDRQIEWYRRAMEDDPGMYQAPYNLGLLLVKLGKYDQAIPVLKKADELYRISSGEGPSLDALCQIALCHARLDQPNDGLPYADRVLSIESELVMGRYARGEVLIGLGKFEEATEVLRQCLEVEPEHAGATHALGTSYAKMGHSELALAALRYAEWLTPDAAERERIRAEIELLAKKSESS